MPPSLSGTVLKKKWLLGDLIGSGGCAQVYAVKDTRAAGAAEVQKLVAKVAPLPSGLPPAISKGKKRKKTDEEKHADMLYYEYTLYNGFLRGHGGVPQIPQGGYGDDANVRFLIMTRLGPDVEVAQKRDSQWSIARKAGYARQMFALLRTLHEQCKMVFVDVKPENFMFGLPGSPAKDKIFLIDFGLSERYTGAAGAIKLQKQSKQVAGTPEFLSLRCHAGAGAGRCDDLESLGYVFLAMLREGSLPWSGASSVEDGLAMKNATSLKDLCAGFPEPLLQYMQRVRSMTYEETPDYDALDKMLQAVADAGGATQVRGAGTATTAKGARASDTRKRTRGGSASDAVEVPDVDDTHPAKSRKGKGKSRPAETTAPVESKGKGRINGKGEAGELESSDSPTTLRRGRSAVSEEQALVSVKLAVNVPDEGISEAPAKKRSVGQAAAVGAGTSLDAATVSPKAKKGAVGRRATSPSTKLPASLASIIGGGSVACRPKNTDGKVQKIREGMDENAEHFYDARTVEGDDDVACAKVTEEAGGGAGRSRRWDQNVAITADDAGGATSAKKKRAGATATGVSEQGFLLEVLSGPHKGQTVRIPSGRTDVKVGRGAPTKSGLRLARDFEVSERHSILRPSAKGIRCEDVGSLNGTFVNAEKLQGPKLLKDGDILQVGQSVIQISR